MKKVLFLFLLTIILMVIMSSVAFAGDVDVGMADNDIGLVDVFLAVLTLAVLIESLAEVVKAAISPTALPKWVWFLITSILGSVLCVMFKVDIFSVLGFIGGATAAVLGQTITGIAVGAGSGFVHVLLGKLTASKNADKVIAAVRDASAVELIDEKSDEVGSDSPG